MKQSPSEEKMERCTRNCNLTDCINKAGGYKECVFYEMIELPAKVESPSEEGKEPLCGDCGQELTLVRLGSHQCDNPRCVQNKQEWNTKDIIDRDETIKKLKIELIPINTLKDRIKFLEGKKDSKFYQLKNRITELESKLKELEKGDQEALAKNNQPAWYNSVDNLWKEVSDEINHYERDMNNKGWFYHLERLKSKFIITRRD